MYRTVVREGLIGRRHRDFTRCDGQLTIGHLILDIEVVVGGRERGSLDTHRLVRADIDAAHRRSGNTAIVVAHRTRVEQGIAASQIVTAHGLLRSVIDQLGSMTRHLNGHRTFGNGQHAGVGSDGVLVGHKISTALHRHCGDSILRTCRVVGHRGRHRHGQDIVVRQLVGLAGHGDGRAAVNAESVAHIAVRLTIVGPVVGVAVGRDGQRNVRNRILHGQFAGHGVHRVVLHTAVGEGVARDFVLGGTDSGLGTFNHGHEGVRTDQTVHRVGVVGQRRAVIDLLGGSGGDRHILRVDLQRTDDRGHGVLGAHIRGAVHDGVGRIVVRHRTLRHVGGGVAHEGHRQHILTVREGDTDTGLVSRRAAVHRVSHRIVRLATIRPLTGSGGEIEFRGREGHRDLAVHVSDIIVSVERCIAAGELEVRGHGSLRALARIGDAARHRGGVRGGIIRSSQTAHRVLRRSHGIDGVGLTRVGEHRGSGGHRQRALGHFQGVLATSRVVVVVRSAHIDRLRAHMGERRNGGGPVSFNVVIVLAVSDGRVGHIAGSSRSGVSRAVIHMREVGRAGHHHLQGGRRDLQPTVLGNREVNLIIVEVRVDVHELACQQVHGIHTRIGANQVQRGVAAGEVGRIVIECIVAAERIAGHGVAVAVIHAGVLVTGDGHINVFGVRLDNQVAGIGLHRELCRHIVAIGIQHNGRTRDGILIRTHIGLRHTGHDTVHRVALLVHREIQRIEATDRLGRAVIVDLIALGNDGEFSRSSGVHNRQLTRGGGSENIVGSYILSGSILHLEGAHGVSTVVVGAHQDTLRRRVGDGSRMNNRRIIHQIAELRRVIARLLRTGVFHIILIGHGNRNLTRSNRQRAEGGSGLILVAAEIRQGVGVGVAHRAFRNVRHRGYIIRRDGQRILLGGGNRDDELRFAVLHLGARQVVVRHRITRLVGMRLTVIHTGVVTGVDGNRSGVRGHRQGAVRVGNRIVGGHIRVIAAAGDLGGARHIVAGALQRLAARHGNAHQLILVRDRSAVQERVAGCGKRCTVIDFAVRSGLDVQRTLVDHQSAFLQAIIVRITDIHAVVRDRHHGGNIVHSTLGVVGNATGHRDQHHIRTVVQGHGTAIGDRTQLIDFVADLLGNRHGRCSMSFCIVCTLVAGRHQNQGIGISRIGVDGQLTVAHHIEGGIEVVVIVGELVGGEAHVVIAYQRAPCRGVTRVGEVIHGVMCT